MNQAIGYLDASKLWLPVTVVVALILAIASGAWTARGWAKDVTNRLDNLTKSTDEISGSLKTLTDLTGKVHQNTGKLDALQSMIAAQEAEVETFEAWINTTRYALAEQGFKTPPLPPPKKGQKP